MSKLKKKGEGSFMSFASVTSAAQVSPEAGGGTDGLAPIYTGSDGELAVGAKRLLKKDPTTKLKALQEVASILADRGKQVLPEFLTHFAFVYRRLSLDLDWRVRTEVNRVLASIAGIDKRALGPHMNALIGHWFSSMHDSVRDVSAAATAAFDLAIAAKKQPSVLAFLSEHILSLVKMHLESTPEALADTLAVSRDEGEEVYVMVMTAALRATGTLVTTVPSMELEAMLAVTSPVGLCAVVGNKLWKKLGAKRTVIRQATLALLSRLAGVSGTGSLLGVNGDGGCLGASLVKAMSFTDVQCVVPLMDALHATALAFSASGDCLYRHMDTGQTVKSFVALLRAAPEQVLPFVSTMIHNFLPVAQQPSSSSSSSSSSAGVGLASAETILSAVEELRMGAVDEALLTSLDEVLLDSCTVLLIKWPGLTWVAGTAVSEDNVGDASSILQITRSAILALLLNPVEVVGVDCSAIPNSPSPSLLSATKALRRASKSRVLSLPGVQGVDSRGDVDGVDAGVRVGSGWDDELWRPIGQAMSRALFKVCRRAIESASLGPPGSEPEVRADVGRTGKAITTTNTTSTTGKKKKNGRGRAKAAAVDGTGATGDPYMSLVTLVDTFASWAHECDLVSLGSVGSSGSEEASAPVSPFQVAMQTLVDGFGDVHDPMTVCVSMVTRAIALLRLHRCRGVSLEIAVQGTVNALVSFMKTTAPVTVPVPESLFLLLLHNIPPPRAACEVSIAEKKLYLRLLQCVTGAPRQPLLLLTAVRVLVSVRPQGPILSWLTQDSDFAGVMLTTSALVRATAELPRVGDDASSKAPTAAHVDVGSISLVDKVAFLTGLLLARVACKDNLTNSPHRSPLLDALDEASMPRAHINVPCSALKWALLSAAPESCSPDILVSIFFGRNRDADRHMETHKENEGALMGQSHTRLVLSWDDVQNFVLPVLPTHTVDAFSTALVAALAEPLLPPSTTPRGRTDLGSRKWARHMCGALSLAVSGRLGSVTAAHLLHRIGLGSGTGALLLTSLKGSDGIKRAEFVLECIKELGNLWRADGGTLAAVGHWLGQLAPAWLCDERGSREEEQSASSLWLAIDVFLSLKVKRTPFYQRPSDMCSARRLHRALLPRLTTAVAHADVPSPTNTFIDAALKLLHLNTRQMTSLESDADLMTHVPLQILASTMAMLPGAEVESTIKKNHSRPVMQMGYADPLPRDAQVLYLSKRTPAEVGDATPCVVSRILLSLVPGIVTGSHSDGSNGYFYSVKLDENATEVQTEGSRIYPMAHHEGLPLPLPLPLELTAPSVLCEFLTLDEALEVCDDPLISAVLDGSGGACQSSQAHSSDEEIGADGSAAALEWAQDVGDNLVLSTRCSMPFTYPLLLSQAVLRASTNTESTARLRGLAVALMHTAPSPDGPCVWLRRIATGLVLTRALALGHGGYVPSWLLYAKIQQRLTTIAHTTRGILADSNTLISGLLTDAAAVVVVEAARLLALLARQCVRREAVLHTDPIFAAARAFSALAKQVMGDDLIWSANTDVARSLVLEATLTIACVLTESMNADSWLTSQSKDTYDNDIATASAALTAANASGRSMPNTEAHTCTAPLTPPAPTAAPMCAREAARHAAIVRNKWSVACAALRDAGAMVSSAVALALDLVLRRAPPVLRWTALSLVGACLDAEPDSNGGNGLLTRIRSSSAEEGVLAIITEGAGIGKSYLGEKIVLARLLMRWLARPLEAGACIDAYDKGKKEEEGEEQERAAVSRILGSPLLSALENLPSASDYCDVTGSALLWVVTLAVLNAQVQACQHLTVSERVDSAQWKCRVAAVTFLSNASRGSRDVAVPTTPMSSASHATSCGKAEDPQALFEVLFLRMLQVMHAAEWAFQSPSDDASRGGFGSLNDLDGDGRTRAATRQAFSSRDTDPAYILACMTADVRRVGVAGWADTDDASTWSLSLKLQLVGATLVCTIATLPMLVRQWWTRHGSVKGHRELCIGLSTFMEETVSHMLTHRELAFIEEARTSRRLGDLTVTGSAVSRRIRAQYEQDEVMIEMKLTLPPNYPLRKVEVECNSKLSGESNRNNQWGLQIMHLMSSPHLGGTVVDAVLLWKASVDKQMEGVEPCPICYGVLHPKQMGLPNAACSNCHYKFHSICLMQWFKTSNKAKCVLCQQDWVY